MSSNKGFSRRDRVSEQIRRELAEVIRSELKDPRVGMISLTEVEVSPDYAHARVYFSSMAGSETLDSVQAELKENGEVLRSPQRGPGTRYDLVLQRWTRRGDTILQLWTRWDKDVPLPPPDSLDLPPR